MPRRRFAIVIGSGTYESDVIRSLQFAESDAEAVYQRMIDPEIGEIPTENAFLFKSPKKAELDKKISDVLRNARPDDFILLYFSGHGFKDLEGQMFFGTRDTNADPFFLADTAVNASSLMKKLDLCVAQQRCLILDCCYAGALEIKGFKASNQPKEFAYEMEKISGGTAVLASSLGGQLSEEMEKYKSSLFTHFLLEAFDGESDTNPDGMVTPNDVYHYIAKKMGEEYGPEQIPVYKGDIVGPAFFLVRSKKIVTQAFVLLQDQVRGLRGQKEHIQALKKIDEFVAQHKFQRDQISDLRNEIQSEMERLREDYRIHCLDEAKNDKEFSSILPEITEKLLHNPDLLFLHDHSKEHSPKDRLIRNHFIRKVETQALIDLWQSSEIRKKPEPPPPPEPILTPTPTPKPTEPWLSPIIAHVRTKSILYLSIALTLSAVIGFVLAWPWAKTILWPPTGTVVLKTVIWEGNWEDNAVAKIVMTSFFEKLNKALEDHYKSDNKPVKFQFDVAHIELKTKMDDIVSALKKGEVDIVGELSPYKIYSVNSKTGAVPFISPMHNGKTGYESLILLRDNAVLRKEINAAQGPLESEILSIVNEAEKNEQLEKIKNLPDEKDVILIMPKTWTNFISYLSRHYDARIAVTDKDSTSSYWFPRFWILTALREQKDSRKSERTFEEMTTIVAGGKEEDLIKEVISGTDIYGKFGAIAGAMAKFKFINLCIPKKPKDGEGPMLPTLNCQGLLPIKEFPEIRNGAYLLRKELDKENPELINLLGNYWAKVASDVTYGNYTPKDLENYLPAQWSFVQLSDFNTSFKVINLKEQNREQKAQTKMIIAVVIISLILVMTYLFIWFRKTRLAEE